MLPRISINITTVIVIQRLWGFVRVAWRVRGMRRIGRLRFGRFRLSCSFVRIVSRAGLLCMRGFRGRTMRHLTFALPHSYGCIVDGIRCDVAVEKARGIVPRKAYRRLVFRLTNLYGYPTIPWLVYSH